MSAQVIYIREPFSHLIEQREIAAGVSVSEAAKAIAPNPDGPVVCRVNGGPTFLRRSAWYLPLQDADILEVIEYPSGDTNTDLGLVLQFALATAASVYTLNPAPLILFFASLAVQISQDPLSQQEQQQQSPTYATGLQGNQARLFQVVPKICGRHQTFPPFASQPYNEFIDHEQYLHVILALGIGNHEIERTLIDDTDINHFADVLTCTYLPPGVAPSAVQGNVINSPEVGGQEMLTGEYIGGFVLCGPRLLASRIEFDIVAPFGIGLQNAGGDVGALEVSWRYEIRSVNEFGSALTPWAILATDTQTEATREVRRWTFGYDLDTPIRPEVRVARLDIKSGNARALNGLVWSGARAFLSEPAPLNANVAHFEVVMRSSKQLTGVSQNRISVIATGMAPQLLDDGTFGPEIATRNAADWLADLWRSDVWGEGLDDSAIDLATLATLRAVWAARQDRFDYVFDTGIDADSAAQLIAESGRARVFRRGGVRTLVRDQLVTLPRTAFHTRNTIKGSMHHSEELPKHGIPDGVIVEYFDNRSWNFGTPIECPCPGVVNIVKPIRIRKSGVTGRIHATREGLFEAAKISFRREIVEALTEMQGAIPPFGSAVRWQSVVTRWKAGDVVEWDADSLTATLTEPVTYGDTPLSIIFMADDGRPTTPIPVSPGGLTTQVILASAPPFDPVTEDGTRERTQYLLGGLADDEMIVKLSRIEDGGNEGGAQLLKVQGYVDDARVHSADNAYLPSPGEIQDPIDTTPGEPGGGTLPIVNITNQTVASIGQTVADPAEYTLQGNGLTYIYFNGDSSGSGDGFLANEWLFGAPAEITITGQFQVRATALSGSVSTGTFDTWLALDADHTWIAALGESVLMRIEIRDIATETIQDTAIIDLGCAIIG